MTSRSISCRESEYSNEQQQQQQQPGADRQHPGRGQSSGNFEDLPVAEVPGYAAGRGVPASQNDSALQQPFSPPRHHERLASSEDDDVPYLSLPTLPLDTSNHQRDTTRALRAVPQEDTHRTEHIDQQAKMPPNLSIDIPKKRTVDTLIKASHLPASSAIDSPEDDNTKLLVELVGADLSKVDTINATATEDPFILESFHNLINLAHKNKKHFIIGRVGTSTTENEADDRPLWYSYYNAQFLNKVLFRTEPQKRLLHRMKARNPLNNMPVVGCAEYYIVRWDQTRPEPTTESGPKASQSSLKSVKTDETAIENVIRRRKAEKAPGSQGQPPLGTKSSDGTEKKPGPATAALSWYWSQFSDDAVPQSPGLQITFLKRPYDSEEPKATTTLSEEEASPTSASVVTSTLKRRLSLNVKAAVDRNSFTQASPDVPPLSAVTPDSRKTVLWSGFLQRLQERYPGGSPASANVFKSGRSNPLQSPVINADDDGKSGPQQIKLKAEFLGTCDDFLYRSEVRQIFREQALEADDAVLFSLPSSQKTSRVLFDRQQQNQEHPELPDVVVVPIANGPRVEGADAVGRDPNALAAPAQEPRSAVCNVRNCLLLFGLSLWVGLFILFMLVPDPASLILPGIVVFAGLSFGTTTVILEIRRKRHIQRRVTEMRERQSRMMTADVQETVATSPGVSV